MLNNESVHEPTVSNHITRNQRSVQLHSKEDSHTKFTRPSVRTQIPDPITREIAPSQHSWINAQFLLAYSCDFRSLSCAVIKMSAF